MGNKQARLARGQAKYDALAAKKQQQNYADPSRPSELIRQIKPDFKVGRLLRSVPLLATLSDKQLGQLGGALVEQRYKHQQVVFQQGAPGDAFYIILSGYALVHREDAGRTKQLAKLSAGDYFGETALLTKSDRGASILADGPLTCLKLSDVKFRAFIDTHTIDVDFAKRRVAVVSGGVGIATATQVDESAKVKTMAEERLLFNALSSNVLFEGMDASQKKGIIAEMYKATFAKGDRAINQGELGDNLYVVAEGGEFTVEVMDEETGQNKAVMELFAGKVFGELAIMYNAPRSASVVASEEGAAWMVDRYTVRRIANNIGAAKIAKYVEYLSRVKLLSPLSASEREKIAEALEEVEFEPNATVFNEGDEGEDMYIVAEGELCVMINDKEVARLGEGDVVGEVAVSTRDKRNATVITANMSNIRLLKLGRTAFQLLLGPLEDIVAKKVKNETNSVEKVNWESSAAKILKNELKVLGTLGKGSFGFVELVQHTKNPDNVYALKAVSKAVVVQTKQQSHILSEKNAMCEMNHPFIVRLWATYQDQNSLFFLLEPGLGGDLFTVLRKHRLFTEPTSKFFAASVILAFEYMHNKDYIYRDLKPENLLINHQGWLKVTDFGFAKKIKGKTWTLCGTPEYLAPEIVAGKGHGKGVDWWTVGVLVYEMLASYTPFYDRDQMKMYRKIARGKFAFPSHVSKQAKDLIRNLLQPVPTQRLGVVAGGARLIKAHPWFKDFSFSALVKQEMIPPIVPKTEKKHSLANFQTDIEPHDVPKYKDDGSNWAKDF